MTIRAANAIFVGPRVEIHTARVRAEIVEIRRGHLADAPDRDGHMGIRRRAQLIEEVDVWDLPEQFVLGAHSVAAAGGRDLEVEMSEQVAVASSPGTSRTAPTLEARRSWRREPGDGGARHTDDEIRAKVRDQVLAHQRQRGNPVPMNDRSASRALSIVPSAMTATPPGARSMKPALVSTPTTRQVPDAV